MLATISPWSLAAFFLAVVGLLGASLIGEWLLTVSLAGLGIAVVLLAIATTRGRRSLQDWGWLAFSGLLNAALLGVTLFNPGILSDRWVITHPVVQRDANQFVRVSREHPMEPGNPLADGEWVDADTEGIRQDDIYARVEAATIDSLPEKGSASFLLISVSVSQTGFEPTTAKFHGFVTDKGAPVLTDAAGQPIRLLGQRPRKPARTAFDLDFQFDYWLIFELPTGAIESLKLELPASAWGRPGTCRFHIKTIEKEPPSAIPQQIAEYKAKLQRAGPPPDVSLGRRVFTKVCMECHTLYGIGSKVGPDLTEAKTPDGRLKRGDVNFLVTNIVDPSAEIAKEYMPLVVTTTSGKVIIGIVKEETEDDLILQMPGIIVVKKKDIEERQTSKVSIMPGDVLKPFNDHEVRSLFAYLGTSKQVPLLAAPDNLNRFFNAKDFKAYWRSVGAPWTMEGEDIVAPGPQTAGPQLLISHLLAADDFKVILQFHPGKDGKGAVHIGDEGTWETPSGYRLEFAAGAPAVLVDREGNRLSSTQEVATVKAGDWNRVEIIGAGDRLQVKLNGHDVAVVEGAAAVRRFIALERSAAVTEQIRFRHLDLSVTLPKDSP